MLGVSIFFQGKIILLCAMGIIGQRMHMFHHGLLDMNIVGFVNGNIIFVSLV